MSGVQQSFDLGHEWAASSYTVGASTGERWETVKAANPWIVPTFTQFAREAIGNGNDRIGVKWLVEIFRWERSKQIVAGDDRFRWNNSWTAFLARDMIAHDPTLDDHIVTREQKAAA